MKSCLCPSQEEDNHTPFSLTMSQQEVPVCFQETQSSISHLPLSLVPSHATVRGGGGRRDGHVMQSPSVHLFSHHSFAIRSPKRRRVECYLSVTLRLKDFLRKPDRTHGLWGSTCSVQVTGPLSPGVEGGASMDWNLEAWALSPLMSHCS